MPTKDPVKNQEYVAKSRSKSRASMGDEAYKKQEAEARKLRRQKAKARNNNANSKIVATQVASNMINDLFSNILSSIPQKRRGRPRKEADVTTTNLSYKERRRIYMRNYMRTYRK